MGGGGGLQQHFFCVKQLLRLPLVKFFGQHHFNFLHRKNNNIPAGVSSRTAFLYYYFLHDAPSKINSSL
jgi:hypothetical protein